MHTEHDCGIRNAIHITIRIHLYHKERHTASCVGLVNLYETKRIPGCRDVTLYGIGLCIWDWLVVSVEERHQHVMVLRGVDKTGWFNNIT